MSYRIRAYRTGDHQEAAELLTRLWCRDAGVNARYLRWRYESNPYTPSIVAVCEHADGIVAMRGAYGMRWRAGEDTRVIPCLGDTVVAQSHEGRGLVQRLTRWLLQTLAERDVAFVVNQSPGPLVERISLRTGWRKAAEWQTVHAIDSGKHCAGDFQILDKNGSTPAHRDGIWIVNEKPKTEELAELAYLTRTDRIGHDRDHAYFQWRFQNPRSEYRFIQARTDRLAGCLILGRSVHRTGRIRILHLSGLDGHIQAVLLEQALHWGKFREVRAWWNLFPRKVIHVLQNHGFVSTDHRARQRPGPLIAATTGPLNDFRIGELDGLEAGNWEACMAQSDVT